MFIWDFIYSFFRAMTEILWFNRKPIGKSLSVFVKSNDGKKLSVALDPAQDIKSVKEIVGPKLGLEAEDIKIILAGKELDDSVTIEATVYYMDESPIMRDNSSVSEVCPWELINRNKLTQGNEEDIISSHPQKAKSLLGSAIKTSNKFQLLSAHGKRGSQLPSNITETNITEHTNKECDLGDQSTVYCVPSEHSPKRDTSLSSTSSSSPGSSRPLGELAEEEVATFHVACSHCRGVRTGKLRVRCVDCKSGAITVDRDPASWQDVLSPRVISGHCEDTACPSGAVAWCEFYFRCRDHISETDTAVPLPLIRANLRSVPCLACTEVAETVLVFECEEKHTICLDCFKRYVESRLRERGFTSTLAHGYTLLCPAGCADSYITEPHHFRVLDQPLYDQYQRFAAEDCLLAVGGVLCPRPGCGAGIFPDPDCNRVSCNPGCGFVFCKLCLEGFHIGDCESARERAEEIAPSYSIDPSRAAQARWEEASKTTIKVSTKPCPKCRIPTERAGGCMHMLCSRCSFEWCWVCQTEWTRDCMGSHWFG